MVLLTGSKGKLSKTEQHINSRSENPRLPSLFLPPKSHFSDNHYLHPRHATLYSTVEPEREFCYEFPREMLLIPVASSSSHFFPSTSSPFVLWLQERQWRLLQGHLSVINHQEEDYKKSASSSWTPLLQELRHSPGNIKPMQEKTLNSFLKNQ